MKQRQSSIKQKLVIAYVFILLLMSGVIFWDWYSFVNVEEMVESGEIVSDLFDTTLEIKRFEKNFFLYAKEEDYQELLTYLQKAEGLLTRNNKEFSVFAGPRALNKMREDINHYRDLLLSVRAASEGIDDLKSSLRDVGREIVVAAESISNTEKTLMRATIKSARHTVFMSVLIFMAAGLIGSIVVYIRLIRPLKILEGHMERVSRGEFSPVPIDSQDREIISLDKAFNRMLHELEEKKGYLVRSEKLASMGTMLFGVAHELNNPLSNISSSCQILMEEIEDNDMEHKKELMKQIEDETDRAKNIVGSLLGYSKNSAKEMVGLKDLVNETIQFIKGEIPTKIKLEVRIPPDIRIFADKQKIQQAFLNLIKNAIDAIKGDGRVSIAADRNPKDGKVEIAVSDTGEGMSEDMISNIFNPFFTTKGAKKGYGLGLFIVHNIIKEHGGAIIVESEPGYGTTFKIEMFPREI